MAQKFRKKYYFIFLSSILGPMSTNSLVPLFEELRLNFGLNSIALISLAISLYIFPFAIFQLFAGTFSDIIDKKTVVTIGFVIFILGLVVTLISVIIKNFVLFLLAFLIQGIGFSFINPTILAILSIISPEEKEGLVYGIYNSSAGAGVSLGAFLSGFLASNFEREWRVLFVLNPLIALIALIFFSFALKDCELLVCRTFELNESGNKPVNKLKSKIKETLIQLRNNLNSRIILVGLLGFLCFFVVITLTNTLNEQIRVAISDLSNMQIISVVSLILTINGLISISLSPITGYLLNKVNPLIMLGIGFLMMSSMIFMPFGNSILHFMIISFTTYVGSAFIWPALFELSMKIDRQSKGTNSAIINSFRFTGYAIVGPVYLICGIPIIYIWVSISLIVGFTMILLYRKI